VEGAIVGAVAGGLIGAAAASAEAEQAAAIEARRDSRGYGRYEREAGEYRRAMSACLEGRGYSVR
jgi:outer membrane lipoprotein SlyB